MTGSFLLGHLLVHLLLLFTAFSLPLPPSLHQHKLLLRDISSEDNLEVTVVNGLEELDGLLEELLQQENVLERSLLKRRSKRQAFLTCPDLTVIIAEYNKVVHIVGEIITIVK